MRRSACGGIVLCLSALVFASCSPSAPDPPTGSQAPVGAYELTIASNCAALPPAMRTRTYLVDIRGGVATASGVFFPHPTLGLSNKIAVSVAGSTVRLTIDFQDGLDHVGLFEEPTPGQYYGILGTGQGSASAGTRPVMTGIFDAAFAYGEDLLRDNLHVGCGRNPNAGTFRLEPREGGVPPGVAGSPIVASVQILGPTSLAPGDTAQFSATATRSDGSVQDITSTAFWTIGGSGYFVFSHAGGGLVTAKQVGEGRLVAVASIPNISLTVTGSRSVIVTPPGTFLVSGVVTASGSPVNGASVAVTSGSSTGLSALTDWEGSYSIFGVAGPGELLITKSGYAPVQLSVSGTGHQTLNATLTPVAAVPDVGGTYALTLEASPSCRANLTPAARRRTYTAQLVQNVTRVFVTLSGGLVANKFEGRADPGDLQFTLNGYWDYHYTGGPFPDVVENVSSNPFRQLAIGGRASAQPISNGYAGRLDGEFLVFDRTIVCCPYLPWSAPWFLESCEATDHTFTLTRTGMDR